MAMTAEDKFNFWFEKAQYDLDTADAMFDTGRWFYVVFACQQALEKLVKGLYILYIDDNVPRIHNIEVVYNRFADKLAKAADARTIQLFADLSSFYLRSRYPDYARELSGPLNKTMTDPVLKQTKEVYQWLLTLKP